MKSRRRDDRARGDFDASIRNTPISLPIRAYSGGYEYTNMAGREESDRLVFRQFLIDELEFLSGNEGEGYAWSAQDNCGDDANKLWLRTQEL